MYTPRRNTVSQNLDYTLLTSDHILKERNFKNFCDVRYLLR